MKMRAFYGPQPGVSEPGVTANATEGIEAQAPSAVSLGLAIATGTVATS